MAVTTTCQLCDGVVTVVGTFSVTCAEPPADNVTELEVRVQVLGGIGQPDDMTRLTVPLN